MANNLGSLVVSLGLDAAQFTRGLSKGEYESQQSVARMKRDFDGLVKYVAGLGIGAALVQSVRSTADASKEIDRLAKLSATSAENFQAQAYAAQQAGISQEKLADIFKDTQDKVGDFLQNGAGPLKDFFDNIAPRVGVTADEFRRLSGPEALQLYVSSLEKANLSQSELTFYMEAIASDSALLLPLLRDNGSEMARLGDEAARLGRVLDNETIEANKRFADDLARLEASMQGVQRTLASGVIQSLSDASNYFIKVANDVGIARAALISFGAATARVFGADDVGRMSTQASANANAIELTVKQIETFQRLADAGDAGAAARVSQLREQYQRLQAEGQKITTALKNEAAAIQASFAPITGSPLPTSSATGSSSSRPSQSRASSTRSTGKDPQLEANQREADMLKLLGDIRQKEINESRQAAIQELADIERRNKAYQSWVDSLVDATPTRKLEEQRATMAALAEEYERGRFGAVGSAEAIKLYGEVTNTYLGNLNQGVQRINATADAAGSIFGSWLERAITDGAKLSDVINGLIQDLVRLAIQKSVIEPAAAGVSTFIGGILGGGLSFDGGGYTGMGARSGGLDGRGGFMAMLHPNETVIDHTKGQSLGGGITIVNNIDAKGADASVLPRMEQMLKASEARTKADIMNSINRGGAWARATGRA